MTFKPFHFVALALAGWLNREQQAVIAYPGREWYDPFTGMHGRTNAFGDLAPYTASKGGVLYCPSAYDVAEGINDTAYMYTLEQVLKQPGVADSPKGKEAAEFLASLQQAIPFLPEVKGLASDSDLARVGQGAKDEARLYVQAWREKIAGFLKELKK